MSEEVKKTKTKMEPKPTADRISLSAEANHRLGAWAIQVRKSLPGVEISRKDLVNWIILSRSEKLTTAEERELASAHYDEVRFLQFALRELKSAKARGEEVNLQQYLAEMPSNSKVSPKAKRAPKKKDAPSDGTRALNQPDPDNRNLSEVNELP